MLDSSPSLLSHSPEIELTLSIAAIVVWGILMARFWPTLKKLRPGPGTGGLIVIVVIWITLISLLIRSLFDSGIVSAEVAALSAATVRSLFIIGGVALILWGPSSSNTTRGQ